MRRLKPERSRVLTHWIKELFRKKETERYICKTNKTKRSLRIDHVLLVLTLDFY